MEVSASSSAKFRDIVWTGSLYVAVGDDNFLMSSPDGITWTKRTPPGSTTFNTWYSVAWSGQKLIAVGSDMYARSTDGVTWTATSTGPYFEAVAWTGTRWIGCGRGKTGYSLDGETWVQQGPGISPSLPGLAFGGPRYVAGGSSGSKPVILSSVDGVAWTTYNFTGDRWINDVAWTGERYVASLSDGRYLVSPDGAAWEEIAGATTTEKKFLIQRNDGVVAFAKSGQAEFTEDGAAWTAGVSRGGASDFGYTSKVRHFPGRTIAVGYNDVVVNTGGNSWVRYPFVGSFLQARDVVSFDGKYVLMCDTKLLESTDGLTWTPWSGSSLPGASDFQGIGITPQGRLLIVRSVAGNWEVRHYDAASGWSPLAETQNAYPTGFSIVGDRLFGYKGGSYWSDDDGLTWDPRGPLPRVNVGLLDVAAFTGGFVATGEYGRLLLSEDDGQHWEGIPTYVENYGYSVAGHGDRLVAMIGGLKTSTDGRIWEPVAGSPINGFKLEWTGNKFAALNYSSMGYVSADGISWQPNPSAVGATSISGVDGRVVGMSSTRNPWFGVDVTTVRQRGIFDFNNIATSGSEYVALSNGPWRSENLIDWDYRGNSGTAPSGIAWTGSRFVTVGGSASNPGYSADGVNWTTVPSTNGIAVIWTGDRLYSFDNSGVVRTSADGSAWTVVLDDTSQSLNAAAWAGSFGVAVGNAGTVLRSTDGSSWSTVASGLSARLNSVTWTGSQLVAAGNGGLIAVSPDGLAWQSVSVGSTSQLNSITSHDGLVVTVSDTGEIFTSSDGATWTKRFGSVEHSFLHVSWARDRFVALGRAGAVVTSSDGLVWETILRAPGNMSIYRTSPGFSESFVAAGASGARWLALGSLGSILHSSDGKVWHEAGRPVTTALRDAVWVDGTFIVVGDAGVILTSPDGTQWTKRETGRMENLVAVTASGQAAVAVGQRGLILRSGEGFALPGSYDEWSESQAEAGESPDADSDGDGFSNLVAYAMGWPAGTAASGSSRSALLANKPGSTRQLVFSLGPDERFDIQYGIERSTNLSTWTTVANRRRGAWSGSLVPSITESVDGMGRRTVTISLSAATTDFYRMRFTTVAP